MRVKALTIDNFRGFDHEEFAFDAEMNVIVGNNTSGKTSILHALQIALGEYLSQLRFLPGGPAFTRNFSKKDIHRTYNRESDDMEFQGMYPDIRFYGEANFSMGGGWQPVEWRREFRGSKTVSRGSDHAQLREIVTQAVNYRNEVSGSSSIFPVLLAFGADRIDKNYRRVDKSQQGSSRIEKAYRYALSEQVDFKSAFDWIYRYNTSAKSSKDFVGTDIAFRKALETGARLQEVEIPAGLKELWATVRVSGGTPRRLPYDIMSDGFKAMVNIVAEIAYRCIMLNGHLGESAVRETPGIVLIDEVDTFLHPHWQKHVLHDLHEAFPKIQFVVTSHSPFIVQSVESRNVISLDGTAPVRDPSQRGIEEIAVTEMGMSNDTIRSEKYILQRELAREYYDLVKVGNADSSQAKDVKARLDELEARMSLLNDPAYEAFVKSERGDL